MRPVALLLFAFACGGSDDVNDAYPPALPLESSLTECATVDDCVAVELGCCDECNGGFAVAVNTDSADAVVADFSETCGLSYACTAMGCAPWELSCDAGTCAMVRGTFE